ncbi:hypothetical protein JCM19297_2629 [Nonlabens ulvanivorans]|nr:hypothetical protein [Nonlabens ulvanivorans]GAK91184.1 hypothetical protein JCM19297_2629 [Nonlabens ulvanivorans]
MRKLFILSVILFIHFNSSAQCDFTIVQSNGAFINVYVNDVKLQLPSNFQSNYTLNNINDGDIIKIIKPKSNNYPVAGASKLQLLNSNGEEVFAVRRKYNNQLSLTQAQTIIYEANCDTCENIQNVSTTTSSTGFISSFNSSSQTSGSTYNILYGQKGFDYNVEGIMATSSTNSFNISVQNGYYDYYLRAQCNGGPTDWIGPFTVLIGTAIPLNSVTAQVFNDLTNDRNVSVFTEVELFETSYMEVRYDDLDHLTANELQTVLTDISRIKGLYGIIIEGFDNIALNFIPDDIQQIKIEDCQNVSVDLTTNYRLQQFWSHSTTFSSPPQFDLQNEFVNSIQLNETNGFDLNLVPSTNLYFLSSFSDGVSQNFESQFTDVNFDFGRLSALRHLQLENCNISNIQGTKPTNLRHFEVNAQFSNSFNFTNDNTLVWLELQSPNLGDIIVDNSSIFWLHLNSGTAANVINISNLTGSPNEFYQNFEPRIVLSRTLYLGTAPNNGISISNVNNYDFSGNLGSVDATISNSVFNDISLFSRKFTTTGSSSQYSNFSRIRFENNSFLNDVSLDSFYNIELVNNFFNEINGLIAVDIDLTKIRNTIELTDNFSTYVSSGLNDLSEKNVLIEFDTVNNGLTTLDLSNAFKWNGNPNLKVSYSISGQYLLSINAKGQRTLNTNIIELLPSNLDVLNLDDLEFICVNSNYPNSYLQSITQSFLNQYGRNLVINDYCSFSPGPVFNKIQGSIRLDSNLNGCDSNDLSFSNLSFNIDNGLFQNQLYSVFSGNYSALVVDDQYTITPPNPENPNLLEHLTTKRSGRFPNSSQSIYPRLLCYRKWNYRRSRSNRCTNRASPTRI